MIKTANSLQPLKSCPVRRVALSDIRKWLAQGWGDIQANPWSSLLYGIIFAAVGLFVSLFLADNPGFFMATAASFLLLGPFLALGLYELNRRRAHGEPVRFLPSTLALLRNPVHLTVYALFLAVLALLWLRLSSIVLEVFLQDALAAQHSYFGFMAALLGSKLGWLFALAFLAVGFMFALVAFVTGVATVPMLLERQVNLLSALNASICAIVKNWQVMLAWAATIALIIGAGLLPFSLGLVVAMPLISYASWHAYRDMVEAG